ncbi:hypothetical protein [Acidovorax sp. A1169]|uniref:hypothetical protein n=1 Tax=Acidovorax sp. A1169 TaxID=3059524 RepID=UPI00273785C5|nr:hypothetical protein [Acidovorax sp. A1169]MDP4073192.1 hypothetical protein [Acidovorax sp. A1169]
MKKPAVLALALLASHGVFAEPLWGKVEAGASLETIKRSYPDGTVIEPSAKERTKSGATLQFRIPSIPIVGENFKASFYLLEDRLEQVLLSFTASKTESDCRRLIGEVREALASKYGPAIKTDQSSMSEDASWSAGKTTIELYGLSISTVQSCSVYVTYSQRIAASAGNL